MLCDSSMCINYTAPPSDSSGNRLSHRACYLSGYHQLILVVHNTDRFMANPLATKRHELHNR